MFLIFRLMMDMKLNSEKSVNKFLGEGRLYSLRKYFKHSFLFLNETFNEILMLNPKGSAPKRGGRYQ